MAQSKPVHPQDRTRFVRLGLVILEELTPMLQDILQNEIPPNQMFYQVKQQKSLYQRLGAEQTALIQNAQTDGYKKFDITLAYTLLRNLSCLKVTAPTQGWGKSQMPGNGETTLGDDIERIRLTRNRVLEHSAVPSLSDTEFQEHWSNISGICKRIQALLGTNYVQRLQNAEVSAIDIEMEKEYLKKIENICAAEKRTRELLQGVIQDIEKLKEFAEETKKLRGKIEENAEEIKKSHGIYPTFPDLDQMEKLTKSPIPPNVRDSEISHEQLEEYMRTGGKTTVRHALGVVVGCGGAGKTTLLHRLMGKNDNEIEEIESTRGLEIHEHIFVVKDEDLIVKDDADSRKRLLGVSRCTLESNKKNSHPVMDYSTAKGNIKDIDALESNKKNSDPAMDYSTTKGNIKNKNDDPAKNTVSTNLNPGTSKETCLQESEKDAMKDILQTVQDGTTVSMIDFAGQFAYYACHQIYMRSKAFFILVLDINQSFEENGEHDIGCKEDSNIYTTWNSKEYTDFWLNSIKSFGGENAPVLLVLTHTEGKSDEDVKNFQEGFWESLSDEVRLWLYKSTEGKMFGFGLKEMDESSKKSLQSLKTSMVDIVSQKFNTELALPSSWALLEYFLREKKDPILSIEDVRKINMERPKEYQLGNASENAQKEISDFLSFLHGHGFLLYFDEDILNTRIILRMQWFSDAFSKLITDKPAECSTIYIKEWKHFHKTGELKTELVDAFWKDEQYSKHKMELMSYMAKLRMFVNVDKLGKDISWYVPCMNKKPFQQQILDENLEYSSILSFRLNSFALFEYYRLVAYCMSKWTVETDKDGLCLYHTAAMFENKNHTVLVGIHRNDIQVQVRRRQDLDSEVSIETGKYVQNALDELTNTFNERKTYERGYKCLNIFCNDKDQTFIPARNFTEIKGNSLQCCCPIEEKHQLDVQKTVGYWEQRPQSRKRLLENPTDSEAKTKSVNHGQTYPFSKNGPQIDVMTSRIKAEVSESVGLIFVAGKKGTERGTGFRVGNKYIMTCLHVVKDIIEDDCRIDPGKIQIQFGMVDPRPKENDQQTVFHFEPTLCQLKDFDLAILELKHEVGKSFPRQLTLSGSLDLSLPVHLIGHPGGVEMKEDSVYLCDIQPNNDVDKRINELSHWSQFNLPGNIDYYSVLRHHPRKILFHTTFDRGSSGAPAIMIQNYKPYVVLMLCGGVPDCHYEEVHLVQYEERIEFGYAMKDIGEEMDRSPYENIRKIAAEIFSTAN